jgi:hypothetical protein
MQRRIVKRRIRVFIVRTAVTIAVLFAVFLTYNIFKSLAPLLRAANISTPDQIVKPMGNASDISTLEKKLGDKNIIFEDLKESSSSSLVTGRIKEGPIVYFSKNKDAEWQVNSLVLILSKVTVDNKKPVYVDLRYERPIVKF